MHKPSRYEDPRTYARHSLHLPPNKQLFVRSRQLPAIAPLDKLTQSFLEGGQQISGRRYLNDTAIFGKKLTEQEIYNLAGAPAHASIAITEPSHGSLFCLEVHAPEFKNKLTQVHSRNGQLFIHHGDFNVRPSAPAGFATRAVAVQVKAARGLGISNIQLLAEGSCSGAKQGYFVWPKMGFNAALAPQLKRSLPSNLRKADTVLDLYAAGREGVKWWADNGSTCLMYLGVKDTSRGLGVLRDYLKHKNIDIAL